jgi:opacity protein-like surface antigen
MKKIVTMIPPLLIFAHAADASGSAVASRGTVEVNYGQHDTIGIQGEMKAPLGQNDEPISLQVFAKHYLQELGPGNSWATTAIGAAVIYDFNSVLLPDSKAHPYSGIGLMNVNYKWRGSGPVINYTGIDSGLYFTLGVKYELSEQVAVDVNYNAFADFGAGLEFKF